MQGNKNGWAEWGKHVIKEQERQERCLEAHDKRITINSIEIAMLKVRCGVFGLIGGLIPALITLAYFIIKHFVK